MGQTRPGILDSSSIVDRQKLQENEQEQEKLWANYVREKAEKEAQIRMIKESQERTKIVEAEQARKREKPT